MRFESSFDVCSSRCIRWSVQNCWYCCFWSGLEVKALLRNWMDLQWTAHAAANVLGTVWESQYMAYLFCFVDIIVDCRGHKLWLHSSAWYCCLLWLLLFLLEGFDLLFCWVLARYSKTKYHLKFVSFNRVTLHCNNVHVLFYWLAIHLGRMPAILIHIRYMCVGGWWSSSGGSGFFLAIFTRSSLIYA